MMSYDRHPHVSDLLVQTQVLPQHKLGRLGARPWAPPRAHRSGRRSPRSLGRQRIGQILVDRGLLAPGDLLRAVVLQQRENARFGDILLAHGMVSETQFFEALSAQYHAEIAKFSQFPPDVRLIDMIGADECLRYGILPWRQAGGTVIIASARPEEFETLKPRLTDIFGPVRMALSSETALHDALLKTRQRRLAFAAETRVAPQESCREMDIRKITRRVSIVALFGLALTMLSPLTAALLFTGWAVLTLIIATGLKLAAAFAQTRRSHRRKTTFAPHRDTGKLPIVSIMVPLFKEREIATRLIKRVSRLTYPRELLDICLVVEEDDTVTQDAILNTDLPRWMRQIIVPRGRLKTKPRALNFARDFCRGSIIGIYDAEDAPDPDQLHKVTEHFAQAPPEVACLQGILDFYNARKNWLSRCFTVEYAGWFRVILPGYERLGLTVPLGGTTLFFRRDAIEKLGGWDAHNVTEDADLGIRLARHGYRTELLQTVTEEEANSRLWPWIKQRSRWLKGYAMTYAVHMRSPRRLWQELGPWRFFGVQALFLGTLSQFILAPFLWSFWMFPLGLPHPLRAVLPHELLIGLGGIFLFSEAVTIAIGMIATSPQKHKWLWPWVPTLHLYYPLATAAAAKALWEMVTKPFYWDKTTHGIDDLAFERDPEIRALEAPPAPLAHARHDAPPPQDAGQSDLVPGATTASELSEPGADFLHQEIERHAGRRLPQAKRYLTFGVDLTLRTRLAERLAQPSRITLSLPEELSALWETISEGGDTMVPFQTASRKTGPHPVFRSHQPQTRYAHQLHPVRAGSRDIGLVTRPAWH